MHPLIINKKHTGYITEIANLVPACGKCNQSKGNSDWKEWMLSNAEKSPKTRGIPDLDKRIRIIEKYDNSFQKKIITLEEIAGKELWEKYQKAYDSIIFSMESAQKIMDEIKQKISKTTNTFSDRPKRIFVGNTIQKNNKDFIKAKVKNETSVKIGEIVKSQLVPVLLSGKVLESEIINLTNENYCRNVFNLYLPMLKKSTGQKVYRYYSPRTTTLNIYGIDYLLTSDWYDDDKRPQLQPLLDWLSKYK